LSKIKVYKVHKVQISSVPSFVKSSDKVNLTEMKVEGGSGSDGEKGGSSACSKGRHTL